MMKKRVLPAFLAAAALGLFCGRDHAGGGCSGPWGPDGGESAFLACYDAAMAERAIAFPEEDKRGYATTERSAMIKKVSPAVRDTGSPESLHSFTRKTGGGTGAVSTRKAASAAERERRTGGGTAASMKINGESMTATASDKNETGAPPQKETATVVEQQGTSVVIKEIYAAPGGLLEKPRVGVPEVK